MEIVKLATEWAKAEVFATRFFILFSGLFLAATFGFWKLGKTEMAKAYVLPTLIAGLLIMAVGIGLYMTNKSRVSNFPIAYQENPLEFVANEMARSEKTIGEYQNIVFKIVPGIIIAAAMVIIFVENSHWRAIAITTIALMVVILIIDSTANARISEYKNQLEQLEIQS